MRTQTALISIVAAATLAFSPTSSFAQGSASERVGNTPQIVGNGQVVNQSRTVGNFTAIQSKGASNVVVRVGPAPSVTVTGDSNIIPLISTEIRGKKLVIDSRGSYRTRSAPRITVTVPNLEAAGLSGSGNMRVEGIGGSSVALAVDGSGNLTATGRAGTLALAVNGSGNADARGVPAGNASVAINGSGNATVATGGTLSGAISGSGNIRYVGRPSNISVVRNGSGDVVPAR